jgi:hypothetical protein
LTFSLKYLVNFCKASGLSGTVKLCLSNEVPLLVEYALAGSSYLRFYLAPKVSEATDMKDVSTMLIIDFLAARLAMTNDAVHDESGCLLRSGRVQVAQAIWLDMGSLCRACMFMYRKFYLEITASCNLETSLLIVQATL